MKRVGIYSGAFDPIHNGHVAFALEAVAEAHLDKVFFLVEPSPRHKQGVKAFEHRLAMVKLAIHDHHELGVVVLDQARFSVHETWPVLQARFADTELSMLMGSDVFARLSHWPRIDELITSATFVVGVREQSDALAEHLAMIEKTRHLKLHYRTFNSKFFSESSSHIRQQLRGGIVPDGIDQRVEAYIRKHQLYSSEYNE